MAPQIYKIYELHLADQQGVQKSRHVYPDLSQILSLILFVQSLAMQ
jgi:hypothetical protein